MEHIASALAKERENASALRLVFSYEGENVKMISKQRVDMKPPPSDPLTPAKGAAGFWYELTDKEGRTLYRRIKQNPIEYAVEVRSDDPHRPLRWEKGKEVKGEFILVVPVIATAEVLTLFSSPLSAGKESVPAKELARFLL